MAFIPDTTASKTTTTTDETTETSVLEVISTNPTTTTTSTKILTIFTDEILRPRTHTTRPAQTVTKRQGKPFRIDETTRRSNTALMTTQSVSEQNVTAVDNQSTTFNLREIIYLITGICVIEVALIAIGIYIAKQRRVKFSDRNLGHEDISRKTTNPYSSLSRDGGKGNYEIIQLKDLSNDQSLQHPEHNECSYIEIIEHEYDYTYGDKAPVSAKIP